MSCLCLYNHFVMFMFMQPFMSCLYVYIICHVYVYITIYVMFICLYNHLCHVYMITIYGMLCLYNHLSCLCLYNHLCHVYMFI